MTASAGVILSVVFLVAVVGLLTNLSGSFDANTLSARSLAGVAQSSLSLMTSTTGALDARILPNPYFEETSGSISGWALDPGVGRVAHDGRSALRLPPATAVRSDRFAVAAGVASVLDVTAYGRVTVTANWYADAGAASPLSSLIVLDAPGSSGWEFHRRTIAAPPPSATRLAIVVASSASEAHVERVSLEDASAGRWERDPERVERFGLLEEDVGGFVIESERAVPLLDAAKLGKLGAVAASENGRVDYDEARAALGLAHDFRLRVAPVIPRSEANDFLPDPHLSVAYVGAFSVSESAASAKESAALDALVKSFSNTREGPGRDKYADSAADATALSLVLEEYDVVVIGSGAALSSFNPQTIRSAFETWVDGGGVLVLLGGASSGSAAAWLDDYGIERRMDGPVTLRATGHAILGSPNPLRHLRYTLPATTAATWEFDAPERYAFAVADAQNPDRAALAVSNPGEFGEGLVVASAYRPHDLLPDERDEADGREFLQNALVTAYRSLEVEFGPTPPAGRPVESARASALVRSPFSEDGIVEVSLVVEAWER